MAASHPSRPHLTGLLLAGVLALVAGLSAGCQSESFIDDPFGQEAEKDAEARNEHYETSALTFYDGGRYDRAEIMADRWLEAEPGSKKAKRVLARSKMMQGTARKLREAEAILVEIVDLDWTHPTRGDIRFEVQSDLATTRSDLADLYHRDVRDLDARLRTDDRAQVGDLRGQLAKQTQQRDLLLSRALPLWQRVLAQNPDNPFALAALAKGNLQLGNDEQGLHYAQQYLSLSKRNQSQYRTQIQAYEREAAKNRTELTRDQRNVFVQKALGARNREKQMHLLVGSVHMRRMDYPAAVLSYGEVLRIDPAVPAAYIERAQAYGAMGEHPSAIRDLEQYLKITDPQRHRDERVRAGEMLQRFQAASRGMPVRGPSQPATYPADQGGGWYEGR